MGILDTILENHTNGTGACIIREQHDTRKINGVRGLTDPGEMIACGYLPELRRQGGESDEAYQARLLATAPQEVLDIVNKAAMQRASYDLSNGRVNAAFARKPAWTGLGVTLDREMNSLEAITFSGQNWRVRKIQLSFPWGEGHNLADRWGIVREDTGVCLGTVGSLYQPIQNEQAFAFLDTVIGQYGARYESAGSLYGGKQVWMQAHMPQQRFTVNGDQIEPYVSFFNPHDGSGQAYCYATAVRQECANTVRTSLKDKGKGIAIRHTGSVASKIARAQEALGLAVEGFGKFKDASETLVRTPCEIRHYANDVLDACLDITEAQAKLGADVLAATIANTEAARKLAEKSFERKIERRGEILEDILGRYDSERCHPRGTAWAAFNAVTEHANHNDIGRKVGTPEARLSRRFESVLAGDRDDLMQVAFEKALALAV